MTKYVEVCAKGVGICNKTHETFFKVPTLESSHVQFDLTFLSNIMAGKIDSLFLLGCFGLHVPQQTTSQAVLFHVLFAPVLTVKFGTFC